VGVRLRWERSHPVWNSVELRQIERRSRSSLGFANASSPKVDSCQRNLWCIFSAPDFQNISSSSLSGIFLEKDISTPLLWAGAMYTLLPGGPFSEFHYPDFSARHRDEPRYERTALLSSIRTIPQNIAIPPRIGSPEAISSNF
jgi:hypothetical protein